MVGDRSATGDSPGAGTVTRRGVLRYGAGVGVLAAAGPVLAACGSDENSGGSSGGGKVELGMWTWAGEFKDAFAARIKEFEAANPNVTVKPRFWDFASYSPALQAALAAKNEADLFMPVTLTLSLGKANRVLELKKVLGQDFIDKFISSTNEENVYNGGQYAVGWAAQMFGIFYNKTIMDKLKLKVPETWDELKQMAPTINRAGYVTMSAQGTPSNQLADFVMPIITQATDDPQVALDLDAHEKPGVTWNSPPVIQALTVVKELRDAGVWDKGVLAVDSDTSYSTFYTGKAALLYTGSFFPPNLHQVAPKSFLTQYGIAKTPALKPGGKHWGGNQAGYTWSISANSKHQDQAIKFLKFLYEDAPYLKMMNDTNSMPATKAAAAGVTSPDIKTMTKWLLDGEGAPHILFGKGSLEAVSTGVVSVINGSASPQQAAQNIENAVVQARKR